jgi:hypothetical protein
MRARLKMQRRVNIAVKYAHEMHTMHCAGRSLVEWTRVVVGILLYRCGFDKALFGQYNARHCFIDCCL